MTQSTTPIYQLPYCDDDEPAREWPGIQKRVSERIEQAFKDAQVPPGNPDLNSVLARLNSLEKVKEAMGTVSVTPSGANGVSARINFPAGLFTSPPNIQLTKLSGVNAKHVPYISEMTKDYFIAGLYAGDGGSQSFGTTDMCWRAVQVR